MPLHNMPADVRDTGVVERQLWKGNRQMQKQRHCKIEKYASFDHWQSEIE